MVWGDIMTSFWPMCVITSAIARFIPIFKLEYFRNAKTYTGEILIWCLIDGVLSEKPQNTHNLNSLFFNGCLSWKFKNWWNDWYSFEFAQSYFQPVKIQDWFAQPCINPTSYFVSLWFINHSIHSVLNSNRHQTWNRGKIKQKQFFSCKIIIECFFSHHISIAS